LLLLGQGIDEVRFLVGQLLLRIVPVS